LISASLRSCWLAVPCWARWPLWSALAPLVWCWSNAASAVLAVPCRSRCLLAPLASPHLRPLRPASPPTLRSSRPTPQLGPVVRRPPRPLRHHDRSQPLSTLLCPAAPSPPPTPSAPLAVVRQRPTENNAPAEALGPRKHVADGGCVPVSAARRADAAGVKRICDLP
jgi:hypothetical protein